MVREDIVEGLKRALMRGESLKDAMMSFFNAGYKKEEIEEAARFVQGYMIQPTQNQQPQVQTRQPIQTKQLLSQPSSQSQPVQQSSTSSQQTNTSPLLQQFQPPYFSYSQQSQQPQQFPPSQVNQRVSNYESKRGMGKSKKVLIIIFSVLLLALVGSLVYVMLYKDEVISALQSLFG